MTLRIVNGERELVPDPPTPRSVTIYLPFVGGAWVGEVRDVPGIRKQAHVGDRLRFDVRALQAKVDQSARVWSEAQRPATLTIAPSDARFVRVGTAVAQDDGASLGDRTFLMDPESKESLVLIYADRACSIRGVGRAEGKVADFAVAFGAAGFHWVRMKSAADGRLVLTDASPGDDAILAVQVLVPEGRKRDAAQP
ncbi:MAG: hypothetical protein U0172_14315 [Nitrospiraceae bacterium]